MTSAEIKETVSFRKVVEMCGLHPNRNGFICCPFHQEKTPSFRIRPKTGICYGCGWEGDIFKFYSEYNHCDFPTAFLALGGEYDNQGKSKRDIAAERAIRLKEAAMKEAALRNQRAQVRRTYYAAIAEYWEAKEAFRFAKVLYPPFSDDWCFFLEDYSKAQILLSIAEEDFLKHDK